VRNLPFRDFEHNRVRLALVLSDQRPERLPAHHHSSAASTPRRLHDGLIAPTPSARHPPPPRNTKHSHHAA
jgi:hypothetical protein